MTVQLNFAPVPQTESRRLMLATTLLKDEERTGDNHVIACNIFTDFKNVLR